jgi:hypothetical protein
MTTESFEGSRVPPMGEMQRRRVAIWLLLAVLAALIGWFGFRGYLNPELLFHFANSLYC